MRCGIVLALAIFLLAPNLVRPSYAAKETVGKGGNRLPKSITPEHYKLKILTHIEDDTPFQFIGDVLIKVRIGLTSLKFIYYHLLFLMSLILFLLFQNPDQCSRKY